MIWRLLWGGGLAMIMYAFNPFACQSLATLHVRKLSGRCSHCRNCQRALEGPFSVLGASEEASSHGEVSQGERDASKGSH